MACHDDSAINVIILIIIIIFLKLHIQLGQWQEIVKIVQSEALQENEAK